MTSPPAVAPVSPDVVEKIDLRDPVVAAFLAWLIPGLGHWYQGRRSKAVLFFVCIMGTFLYGMYLGEGRVVYASWRENDHRLPFLCQAGIGSAAIPSLVQAQRFRSSETRLEAETRAADGTARVSDWLMAPPSMEHNRDKWGDHQRLVGAEDDRPTELDALQRRLHRYFELGTVFTMIAGLLNILAIFDAGGGPAFSYPAPSVKKKEPEEAVASEASA